MDCGKIYTYQCNWIRPPHPKIFLCICEVKKWGFWVNSDPRSHGIGQLPISPADHPETIVKNCYLDLSTIKAAQQSEVKSAHDRGEITSDFAKKIVNQLEAGVDLLNDDHSEIALVCLRQKLSQP